MTTTTTEPTYTIHSLGYDADEGRASVSVLYAAHVDSDNAPTWDEDDDAAVAAFLAAEHGGAWERAGEYSAGDHPTRLEGIATWRRIA